jgi:excisionase family DNA binding protein
MENVILTSLTVPEVKQLLRNELESYFIQQQQNQPETDQLLTVQQAAQFLTLATATIYSMVCRGEIPSSKRGKRLYFSKQELTAWVKSGRNKTLSDHNADADAYLSTYKKGGK